MVKLFRNKKEKGFTLIELFIIAAIIGILIAIAVPNLRGVRSSTNEAAVEKTTQVIHDEETQFYEQDLDDTAPADNVRDYTNE